QQTKTLVIANRTHTKAVALAESFSGFGNFSACRIENLPADFDLVIHAAAAGLIHDASPVDDAIARGACCYDLTYGPDETPFVAWARANGAASTHDGWGMLVEQAAESFYIWRGKWPDTAPLIASRPF
ncbi:MAG: shikimate dehydrogenase, partial [Gammaproteobacteria bacterium]|nr:shikimate dehydrogenase [Gammaproteobacteria bacterium]